MNKIFITKVMGALKALEFLYSVAGVPLEQIDKKLLKKALDEARLALKDLHRAFDVCGITNVDATGETE